MSYILEALKKSQSDRELGQVPRIEGFGIDVPMEPPRSHLWAYLGLLSALPLLGLFGFLLLRGFDAPNADAGRAGTLALSPPVSEDLQGRPLPPPARPVPPAPAQMALAETRAPRAGFSDPSATPTTLPELMLPPPRAAAPQSAPTVAGSGNSPAAAEAIVTASAPDVTAASPTAAPLPLTDPEHLSIEPEVLVVPAPAAPGEPLPRGAEELRRALLGDSGRDDRARISASVDGNSALPAPPPPDAPLPSERAPSEQTPVPEDLLAEIEAFKELVRERQPERAKRAAAGPAPLPEPPGLVPRDLPRAAAAGAAATAAQSLPPRPSLALRNQLPPFSMNVHVYNADPDRRFVYINGRKLSEQQQSPEGIRLEQVVADGAVLSYNGERFFQGR
jgi:general secretion pathway protein B